MSLFRNESPALGSPTVSGTLAVSTADALTVGGKIVPQTIVVTETLQGTTAATATNFGVIFIADRAYTVTRIAEAHTTKGSDGSAVTLTVEKLTGTQAPDAGADLLGATKIDLRGNANTVQAPALSTTVADLNLAAGDRLCLKDSGTLTALAGVQVTVTLKCK